MQRKDQSFNVADIELPHAIEAEQLILAHLLDPLTDIHQAIQLCQTYQITPQSFYYTPHKHIFSLIMHLYETQIKSNDEGSILLILLNERIKNITEECGGLPYLEKLASMSVAFDVFENAVKIVRKCELDRNTAIKLLEGLKNYSLNGDFTEVYQSILESYMFHQNLPFIQPYTAKELLSQEFPIDFIINPFLRTNGILLLVGPAGIGKSLLALYIALKVTQGQPLFGQFQTKPTRTLYIDAETSEATFKLRLQNFITPNDAPENFIYYPIQTSILSPTFTSILSQFANDQQILVILDSLIRFHSYNENDPSDMKKLAEHLRFLSSRFNCAFIITHHTRKSTPYGSVSDTVRGSTELRAFPDSVLILKRLRGSSETTIDIDKCRDSHLHNQMRFKIRLNTPENALWDYEFLGWTTEDTSTKIDEAIKLITCLLEERPYSRKELIEHLQGQGISQRHASRALSEMKSLGTIMSYKEGRFTYYKLTQQPHQPEDTIDVEKLFEDKFVF